MATAPSSGSGPRPRWKARSWGATAPEGEGGHGPGPTRKLSAVHRPGRSRPPQGRGAGGAGLPGGDVHLLRFGPERSTCPGGTAPPPGEAHWHVDHLLAQGQPVGALLVYSEARLECRLAEELSRLEGVRRHVPGFGASDCRCPGHLLLCEEPVQAVGGAIQGVLNRLQDGPLG
ncbi:MAG TPA: DUF123 domain-containing protein [Methanomassiliicoccales archaeon]|nr:DUF123 domain-containing protein [Methanomassiliicoccales archaeon]